MDINYVNQNGVEIAVIQSEEIVITDLQSALDLMATARYGNECDRIVIPKIAIAEDFFVLSTKVAGEILQKFVTYQCKLAIYGDYSHYTSKPLRDFIYESNNGGHIFFVSTKDEAVNKLAGAF
jgi:hypothetical protein